MIPGGSVKWLFSLKLPEWQQIMRLNPYKRHCLTILFMWENISEAGICSFLKYPKATGSLILLKPSRFKTAKSLFSRAPLLKTFLFRLCSNQRAFIPLSKLLVHLKTNKPATGVIGVLFAIKGYLAVHKVNTKTFITNIAGSFNISLPSVRCLNVHKYV
jgi:hypothetical protein